MYTSVNSGCSRIHVHHRSRITEVATSLNLLTVHLCSSISIIDATLVQSSGTTSGSSALREYPVILPCFSSLSSTLMHCCPHCVTNSAATRHDFAQVSCKRTADLSQQAQNKGTQTETRGRD